MLVCRPIASKETGVTVLMGDMALIAVWSSRVRTPREANAIAALIEGQKGPVRGNSQDSAGSRGEAR